MRLELDFTRIREHHGSRYGGFEELCCQLASLEDPAQGSNFIRKGPGADQGVECYRTYADGHVVGWQAKYFVNGFGDTQVRNLQDSLEQALRAHPTLTQFVVCLPVDLKGAGGKNKTSELAKFQKWKSQSIAKASQGGRPLAIELWSASEITKRLGYDNPAYSGRARYWFDTLRFTQEWFHGRFEIQKQNLRDRYSPQSHVELPVTRALDSIARNPWVFATTEAAAATVKNKTDGAAESLRLLKLDAHAESLVAGVTPFVAALDQPTAGLERNVPVDSWLSLAAAAHDAIEAVAHALRAHYPAENTTTRKLHDLYADIQESQALLQSKTWRYVNERVLLLTGPAGIGKSHLLADFGAQQLDSGRPFVLVLTGTLSDSEPWPQIRAQMDLSSISDAELLGALDAAAEASGCRAVLAIDALNENHGVALWRDRLRGFLASIAPFPRIAVVLTVRDTYLPYLPLENIPQLQLKGFAGSAESAARAYLDKRGITRPSSPNLAREFQNPLFLRTCCAFLDAQGFKELPRGLDGITAIFDFYLQAVAKQVERSLDLLPQQKAARKALDAFIAACVDEASSSLPVDAAIALFDSYLPSTGLRDRSLLAAYLSEGVLTQELETRDDEQVDVVRFTFERLSDHLRAERLLASIDRRDAPGAFKSPALLKVFSPDELWENAGVVEALAVQVPQELGCEIFDLLPPRAATDQNLQDAFYSSLRWRTPHFFTEGTLKWVKTLSRYRGRSVYGALLLACTEPENRFNAEYLHETLAAMTLPQRDADWSIFLAEDDLQAGEAVGALIEWAWDTPSSAVAEDRLHLAAVVLVWFFTASNRAVRDRATKALVNLLSARLSQAAALIDKFSAVNDPYVLERLLAACYGAALQGQDKAGCAPLAAAVWRHFFADGKQPPLHLLSRDYALGILLQAQAVGHLPSQASIAAARAKFTSPWPLEAVEESDLERFRARGYGDDILSSCDGHGDFGNYTVTTWLHAITDIPVALAGKSIKATFDAWEDGFAETAGVEQLEAYVTLKRSWLDYVQRKPSRAKSHDSEAAGSDGLWDTLVKSNQAFRATLSPQALQKYEQLPERHLLESARTGRDDVRLDGLDYTAVRRWIALRAHELGWTEELFGTFDDSSLIFRERMGSHRIERIGKKYQRIALAEVTTRLMDNLAVSHYFDDEQLRVFDYSPSSVGSRRNIDPSLLLRRAPQTRWDTTPRTWWTPTKPRLPTGKAEVLLTWLPLEEDLCNTAADVEVTSPDGRQWLIVDCHRHWTREGETRRNHADAWSHVSCLVTKVGSLEKLVQEVLAKQRGDSSRLRRLGGPDCFLGEHGWREPRRLKLHADTFEGIRTPFASVSQSLTAENNTEDNSIDETFSTEVPTAGVMSLLKLRLRSGKAPEYLDEFGTVRWMDPSLTSAGPSAAVVCKDFFVSGIERASLAPLWVIAGEKNVYSGRSLHGDLGWGGRLYHTTVLGLVNGGIVSARRSHLDAVPRWCRGQFSTSLRGQRCGSSSATRLAGCVGSRSSTSRRYAYGSCPFIRAE